MGTWPSSGYAKSLPVNVHHYYFLSATQFPCEVIRKTVAVVLVLIYGGAQPPQC